MHMWVKLKMRGLAWNCLIFLCYEKKRHSCASFCVFLYENFLCTKVAHPRSCHVRAEYCVPYADRHACCRWLHVMQIFHYFKYTPIVHWLIVGIGNTLNARLHTLYPFIITARFWHYHFYIYNAVHVTSGLGGFSLFGHCVCQMLPCMSVCFYALCTEECSALNVQNSADQNRILPRKKKKKKKRTKPKTN